jgi:hypothetical protein
MNATRDFVFYSERSSDQCEIFSVKFSKELFHWVDWLMRLLNSNNVSRRHVLGT